MGSRESHLREAWEALGAVFRVERLSRLYETRPLYVADQPLYLNAVGALQASVAPDAMLEELHRIEAHHGRDREREIRMGPRTLDLDILLCDDLIIDRADLTVPHPRIGERRFVLVPLLELDPALLDPRTGVPYARMLRELEASGDPSEAGGVYLYQHG
jgi:2-amino-4-hydroxy-6-hydroxymethyldihydropteridine diphosphokinase